MRMSIEACLTVNFLIDFAIFSIAANGMHLFRIKRIFTVSLMGALYAALALRFPVPWRLFPVQVIILYWLSSVIIGSLDFVSCIAVTAMLFIGGIICGGSGILFGASGSRLNTLAGVIMGIIAFGFLLAFRKRRKNDWNADIIIRLNRQSVRITALIDTGNRLHDPITGLPVLIAEKQLVEKIMPAQRLRRIHYGALGGNGTLNCFMPDSVQILINNKLYPAPDVWIAVSEKPLPGINRALAPCEFASLPHR